MGVGLRQCFVLALMGVGHIVAAKGIRADPLGSLGSVTDQYEEKDKAKQRKNLRESSADGPSQQTDEIHRYWHRVLDGNGMLMSLLPPTPTESPTPDPTAAPIESSLDRMLPGDLNVRFNKIKFAPGSMPNGVLTEALSHLPMTAIMYPVSMETMAWLQYSNCPSVQSAEDCYECRRDNIDIPELIDIVGGLPLHPTNDTESPYWDELRHVMEVNVARRDGTISPTKFMPLPYTWRDKSMDEVAECVHDEYPGLHHSDLIQTFMIYNIPVDTSIIPHTCTVEFVRGIVMLADLNTWAVATVGPINFVVKYYGGRARPEEVVWQIAQGNLVDGVPDDIIAHINALNLQSAESFTAYPEGSPDHPSWPAMHSAASVSSIWMATVLNLSEEELCEARKVDWAVSYARTVAGVHFVTDNIAGLLLGQELIIRALPAHLAYRYGSDPTVVAQKAEDLRYNWTDFPSSDCFLSGIGNGLPVV